MSGGRGASEGCERNYVEKRLWPEDEEETSSTCLTYVETTVQIESRGGNQTGNEEGEDENDKKKDKEGKGSECQPLDVNVDVNGGKRKRRKKRTCQRASSDNHELKGKNGVPIPNPFGTNNSVQQQPQLQNPFVKPSVKSRRHRHHHRRHHHRSGHPQEGKLSELSGRFPTSFNSLEQSRRGPTQAHHQLQRNAFSFESTLDNGRSAEIKERLLSLVADFSRRASRTKQKIQRPITPTSDTSDQLDEDASEPQLMNRMVEFFPNFMDGSGVNIRDGEAQVPEGGTKLGCQYKILRVWKTLRHVLFFNFVLDAQSKRYVAWLMVVALCFLYNAWVISLRIVFPYQSDSNVWTWFVLDSLVDLVYFLDTVAIKSSIKFIRNGFWVKDSKEIRRNYFHSFQFKIGLLALLPIDIFFALFLTNQPWLRLPRLLKKQNCVYPFLIKIESFWELFRRFDTILSSPHPVRIFRSLLYMLYLIHIYACAYYTVSSWERNAGYRSDWIFDGVGNAYIRCFHFATKTVTSIGKNPKPENEIEYLFMTCAWLSGVFVFAILIGQIRDIIATATKNQTEYRQLLYAITNYLHRIGVPRHLQERVHLWLTYTWQQQKTLDETEIVSLLPHKMQTDIALHVHIGMLNKVKLFQHCEVAFLRDLVLKLRSIIFLPGDFVCRKGEVGREMYIVKTGRVDVIGGEVGNEKLLASLHAGSVFGEIALLQIGGMDKRTADVKSAGFSNLFILSKKDIEEVVKDYPDAQESLRKQAKRLMKQKARRSKDDRLLHKEKRMEAKAKRKEAENGGRKTRGAAAIPLPALVTTISSDKSDTESDSHSMHIIFGEMRKKKQPKLIDTVLQLVPYTSKTAQYLQYGSKVASSATSLPSPSSGDIESFSSYPPSPFLPASNSQFPNLDASLSNSSSDNALSIPCSGVRPQTTAQIKQSQCNPHQPSHIQQPEGGENNTFEGADDNGDRNGSKSKKDSDARGVPLSHFYPTPTSESDLEQEQDPERLTKLKMKANKFRNSLNVSTGNLEEGGLMKKVSIGVSIENKGMSSSRKIPLSVSLSETSALKPQSKVSKVAINLSPALSISLPQFNSNRTQCDDSEGNNSVRLDSDSDYQQLIKTKARSQSQSTVNIYSGPSFNSPNPRLISALQPSTSRSGEGNLNHSTDSNSHPNRLFQRSRAHLSRQFSMEAEVEIIETDAGSNKM